MPVITALISGILFGLGLLVAGWVIRRKFWRFWILPATGILHC